MLKTIRVLRSPADANTAATSSTAADDNGQESSTEQQDGQESTEGSEEQSTEETVEESESSTEATETETQEEQTEVTEEKVEETVAAVLDKPEDEKLPFHKEPRFQELIKEKNTYKQELETLKPLAQRTKVLDDFVQQNGIQPQQVQEAFEYLKALQDNPARAHQIIKPIYEKLAQFVGEVLPADLQAKVAAGVMTQEDAQSFAKLQAAQMHQQYRGQNAQQVQAVQQHQGIVGALDAWDFALRQRDPDFKPRDAQNANAVDGKYEYVRMKVGQLLQANPPRTTQDAVAIAEKAYAEASKFFGQFKKTVTVKKPLKSTNNNSGSNAVVKTAEDVTRAVLAGKRPHQLRYS